MTVLDRLRAGVASRVGAVILPHRRSAVILLLFVLPAVLTLDILTFTVGFDKNDDAGTYTWQAFAFLKWGELAHYTYWYDHPPAGWMQIAGWAWLTRGFERADIGILMASEFMVAAQLAACVFMYILMRRLDFNRFFATLAVLLFAFSPLAINFQKMAFLDNMAVTWMLAALVFAASPRRSLAAAFGAGLCMAVSTLTKETAAIWIFVCLYLMWQRYPKGHRAWALVWFFTTYFLIAALYLLYATLKNELVPGEGHVSLLGSLWWQFTRDSAGGSPMPGWLYFDRWLLYAAFPALVAGLFVRRLRPLVLGYAMLLALVYRGGYVPAPFVIGMLPFAAMLVAGVLGWVWPRREQLTARSKRFFGNMLSATRIATVLAVAVATVLVVVPDWTHGTRVASSRAEVDYYQDAMAWVLQNVPKDAVLAVDDNMWGDLRQAGYTNVVWFYKLDLDPEVQEKFVPNGYEGIDYVILKRIYLYIAEEVLKGSVITKAVANGQLRAEFGNPGGYTEPERNTLYAVYQVDKNRKPTTTEAK